MNEQELREALKSVGITDETLISSLLPIFTDPKQFAEFMGKYLESKSGEKVEGKVGALVGEIDSIGVSMDSLMEMAKSSMGTEEFTKNMETAVKEGRISQTVVPAINAIASGVELSAALGQIKQGKKELAQAKAPTPPTVPRPSEDLARATDMARARIASPFTAGERTAQMSMDALNRIRGLEAAKIASGGQGGQFQTFAQSSQSQAQQAQQARIAQMQQARQTAEQQYAGLAGVQANERQNIANLQNQLYQQQLQRYLTERQSAAATQSMGRQNALIAMRNLAQPTATLATKAMARYTGLGDSADALNQELDFGLGEVWNAVDPNTNPYLGSFKETGK